VLTGSRFLSTRIQGDIHATSIYKNAPIQPHLFAIDYFLFFMGFENEAQTMKNILLVYDATFGRAISLLKSEIFCSRDVPQDTHNSFSNILEVQVIMSN